MPETTQRSRIPVPKTRVPATDNLKWFRIAGLILAGFFAARLLSPAPIMPVADTKPVSVAPAAAPSTPVVVQQPAVAPVVVQAPAPVIVQPAAPQVTILKPQETIVIQKSYPSRTIVLESPAQVMVQ